MSSTDFDQFGEPNRRRKFITWTPNFDAGTATLILTMASGIYYFGGELKETRLGLETVKRDTVAEASRNKEAIGSVAADVKAMSLKVNDMSETLAVIRATQVQRQDSKK